jgi:DNA polymerase III epsilon subunit-like protein
MMSNIVTNTVTNAVYGIAIDTETTGLEAGINEILSLSAILFDKDFNEIDRYQSNVRPMHPILIDDEALKINGFKRNDLINHPLPIQVRSTFLDWVGEYTEEKILPLGHNFAFDKGFLQVFFAHYFDDLFHYKFRDTFVLAQGLIDSGLLEVKSTSLIHLCDHFEIPHKPHDSFGDAWATLQLYKKLISIIKGGSNA